MLGAGGSVLTVPALVYLLDQPVGAATTASLAIVAANAAVGAGANARSGTLDLRTGLSFAPATVLGAVAGTALHTLADGDTILFLLGLVMLGSAWALWRGRPEETAASPRPRDARRLALVAALGIGVGILTGFFGVGGGFVILPVLILVLGLPLRLAIGTSLLIIAITSLAGFLSHLAGGELDLEIVLAFGGGGVVGTWLGTIGSRRVSVEHLSRAFAALLVVVAVALLVANAGPALPG